jgi:hypothetical protein
MATKTFRAATDTTPTASNGHGASGPVRISPPRPRVRIPELGVGLVVIIVFALGAAILHLNSTEQSPALAVGVDVARGDVIAAADVRVVHLSSDDAIAHLDDTQMASVVGRVATVDLSAGSLLSSGVLSDPLMVEAGDAVAGLALEPGQYPARGLAAGDRVNVIRSSDTAVDGSVIARDAVVFDVEDLSADRRLVSIVTTEDDAEAIATVAGTGTLRLVMVTP